MNELYIVIIIIFVLFLFMFNNVQMCKTPSINNSKSSKNEIIKVNTKDKFNNMNNNSLIDNENIIDYIDSYLKNLLLEIDKKKVIVY